jgi:hypothetical protein
VSRVDPGLALRVARAGAPLVQPAREGFAAESVVPPLRLEEAPDVDPGPGGHVPGGPAAGEPQPGGQASGGQASAGPGPGGRRWVAVVADGAGSRWTVPLVNDGDRVRRAVAGDGVAEALVAFLSDDAEPPPDFDALRWHGEPAPSVRPSPTRQPTASPPSPRRPSTGHPGPG